MAGIGKQPASAGRDLTPLLKAPKTISWEDVTFSRIHKRWLAVIDNQYKLAIGVSN